MDIVNCMLRSSGVPKKSLGEALFSICFILNRVPQRDSDITLYECWKGRTPNIQFFKVWGCLTKVSISKSKKKKISPKTVDAIFIGHALDSNVKQFLVVNYESSENLTTPSLKLGMLSIFRTYFLSNLESLVIPLLLILPRIFLVLLLPLILYLEGEKELRLLHPSVKTSSPIL